MGSNTKHVHNPGNIVAVLASNPPYKATQSANGTESPYLLALQTALQEIQSPIGNAALLPGTFIPTAEVAAEIPPQIYVAPAWGGLSCKLTGSAEEDEHSSKKQKLKHSVRDLVIANGVLYVADEAGKAVRMYDPKTGVPWGSTEVKDPIHLAVQDGNLYVGSKDSVFSGTLAVPPQTSPAPPSPDIFSGQTPPYPAPPVAYTNSATLTLQNLGLDLPNAAVSGMTFDDLGNLYVALREAKAIYQFQPNPNGGNPPFISGKNPLFQNLPDQPEFLLWLPS